MGLTRKSETVMLLVVFCYPTFYIEIWCDFCEKSPIHVSSKVDDHSSYRILEGHFVSPLVQYLPDVVPKESHNACFQILIPKQWRNPDLRPMTIQLAGTGDHQYWRRRRFVAKPLLRESGVGSILLENPFYGYRKPKDQTRSVLHNVSDIFVMGGCLILECLALLYWCEREGFGPIALTGISMGGHMASLAGCSWSKPIGIVPCLSWTTASCVFTQGVMSGAIPWDLLQTQYFSDESFREECQKMIDSANGSEAFRAGKAFVRHFDTKGDSQLSAAEEELIQDHSFKQTLANLLDSFPPLDIRFDGSQKAATEAINFMRGLMDECTHLGNFDVPVDPTLAICVAATKDAYYPREGIPSLPDLWPGCEVRYVNSGHVAAFLFNQPVFRKAIVDSLERTALRVYNKTLFPEVENATIVPEGWSRFPSFSVSFFNRVKQHVTSSTRDSS